MWYWLFAPPKRVDGIRMGLAQAEYSVCSFWIPPSQFVAQQLEPGPGLLDSRLTEGCRSPAACLLPVREAVL